MKGGKIYRVYNAEQSKDENGLGNAIWGFNPIEEYENQDDFIETVKNRTDYQNAVVEYHKKIEEEKIEQEKLLREQKEREESLHKANDDLEDLWDILPEKYRMEACIKTTRGKTIDVLVCRFPDAFKAKMLHWDSDWFPVSGYSKVIQTYTEPVLMNNYR